MGMSKNASLVLGERALQGLVKGQADGQGWVGLLRRGEEDWNLYAVTKKTEVESWTPDRVA